MPYTKRRKTVAHVLTVSMAFGVIGQAWAEEKSAEAAAEAPAEGSEEAKSSGAGESTSNSDREWAKRKTKLNVLETSMKDLTRQLQHLIKTKNNGGAAVDEKGKPIDLLATIASSYKKLKDTVSEYNTEKSELKFRFPEEGARIERRYVPLRVQSLEQIERHSAIDSELTLIKKKIEDKYETFVGDELVKPPPERLPAAEATLKSKKAEAEKESKRLRLSQ